MILKRTPLSIFILLVESLSIESVQSLINFAFLELANHLHIFFAYGILLEIVELGGVVGEVKQIDLALMFGIELIDICLHIEVIAEW